MSGVLLSVFFLLLIITSPLQDLRATQDDQGKPIPINPVGPVYSGRSTCLQGTRLADKVRLVIRDRDAWLDLWKRMFSTDPSNSPGPPLAPWAEIDFSREMLVVAAMGQRPTSGYCIFIDKAYEQNDRIEVVVRSVENRKCGVFPVLTAPMDIVRIPKSERSVVFHETEADSDCGESLLRGIHKTKN